MSLDCRGEFSFLPMRMIQLFVSLVVTLLNITVSLTTKGENARSKDANAKTI
jgi:hypothetical protein